MARIRSIKPEFFESEDVAALPIRARLLWIGLWVHCDNYGRCKDNTRLVKKNVWPLDPDVSLRDVEDDLAVLADHGRIVRYESEGTRYLAVVNFDRHQSIARPGAPKYPAPPAHIDNVSRYDSDTTVTRTDASLGNKEQGTGNREGNARGAPPPYCSKHVDNPTNDPCGACGTARRAREQWESDQVQATRDCRLCNLDGYRLQPGRGLPIEPPERCDHRLRSVS